MFVVDVSFFLSSLFQFLSMPFHRRFEYFVVVVVLVVHVFDIHITFIHALDKREYCNKMTSLAAWSSHQ